MIIADRYRRSVIIGLLAASFALAHLCFLAPAFQPWNLQATDLLFDLRNRLDTARPTYDPQVAYIEITDSSGAPLGTPYLNRGQYARLIENLSATQTALQVHDAVFRAPRDDDGDEQLVAAAKASENIVWGFIARAREANGAPPAAWPVVLEGAADRLPWIAQTVTNFGPLAAAAGRQGFLDMQPDIDGVFRRAPLVMRGPDGIHPSLALAAVCAYLEVPPEQIVIRPGRSIRLGERVVIPIDDAGNVRVNFIGPWESMDHYRFEQVYFASEDELDLELLQQRLQGRVLVVADVTTDAGDIGPNPFDENYPLVGIHANLIHSILSGQFLREFGWREMLPIELLLLAGVFLLAQLRSTPAFLAGGGALLLFFLAGAVSLFLWHGTILHLVRPPLMLVCGAVSTMVYRYVVGERARAVVETTFQAYFPPKLVRKLVANPKLLTAKGRRATLTILFSDIKDFSARSASMDPADVQAMLNDYFAQMADIVFAHGGTLDKFIGDGLMVFFGDPDEQPDHADRAVRTAIAMQRRLREINQARKTRNEPPTLIRVGINTGEVLVGNMGSPRRLTYTVLGAAVNLAARLESAAPIGGVLISQQTKEALSGEFSTRAVEPIHAKGFPQPVPAYEVDV